MSGVCFNTLFVSVVIISVSLNGLPGNLLILRFQSAVLIRLAEFAQRVELRVTGKYIACCSVLLPSYVVPSRFYDVS